MDEDIILIINQVRVTTHHTSIGLATLEPLTNQDIKVRTLMHIILVRLPVTAKKVRDTHQEGEEEVIIIIIILEVVNIGPHLDPMGITIKERIENHGIIILITNSKILR